MTVIATRPTRQLTPAMLSAAAAVLTMAIAGIALALDPTRTVLHWFQAGTITVAGIFITIIDIRERRIPNRITAPLAAALATSILVDAIIPTSTHAAPAALHLVLAALLGAIVSAAAFFLLGILGGTGAGDIKLAAILGGILNTYLGPTTTLAGFVLAFVLASPLAIVQLARRRRRRSTPPEHHNANEIPFGPFLLGGAAAATIAAITLGLPA